MPDESTAAVWLTMILQSRVLDISKTDVFYVYIYQQIDSSYLSVSCWSCPEAKHLISQMLQYISCEQRAAEKMFIDPESLDQTKVGKWSTFPSAWITVALVPQSQCNQTVTKCNAWKSQPLYRKPIILRERSGTARFLLIAVVLCPALILNLSRSAPSAALESSALNIVQCCYLLCDYRK